MTTKVSVHANHGWPVDVFTHGPKDADGNSAGVKVARVPANETRDFYVHSTQDLFIHEVQPSEIEAEARLAEEASS